MPSVCKTGTFVEMSETRMAKPSSTGERGNEPDSPDWVETQEWVDALRDVARSRGPERASGLLQSLQIAAQRLGVSLPVTSRTPYVNTIPVELEPRYPGNIEIEGRIKSIIRWNAMAMVSEANEKVPGHRRPHLDLRLCRDAVRGRLQPLLPRPGRPQRRRPRLLPGARLARHLLARLPRGPADARSSCTTSAASSRKAAASPRTRTRG